MKLFFGSIFEGSWGPFWEAFAKDFGGPGRLLGGKMGEKREQKRRKKKDSKKRSKKELECVRAVAPGTRLRLKSLSRRGLGDGRRQKLNRFKHARARRSSRAD